jgi:hypothetical protein
MISAHTSIAGMLFLLPQLLVAAPILGADSVTSSITLDKRALPVDEQRTAIVGYRTVDPVSIHPYHLYLS